MGHDMMNGMANCGGGMMTLMGIFWLLLVVLIVLGIIYLARALNLGQAFRTGQSAQANGDQALEIARQRYARGEIDKGEFETLKRELS